VVADIDVLRECTDAHPHGQSPLGPLMMVGSAVGAETVPMIAVTSDRRYYGRCGGGPIVISMCLSCTLVFANKGAIGRALVG